MSTLNPAAQAIIEALGSPDINAQQRSALTAALSAVLAPSDGPTAKRKAAPVAAGREAESIRFGKESVAALPLPADGERYVYDTECPQLAVRLRAGGKTYIVQQWDRERRRSTRITLGRTDALTVESARKQARALVAAISDGADVRRTRDTGLTVRAMLSAWFDEKSKTKRTAGELRDKALHYLGPLADRPAGEIQREDIGRIHHHIATKARKRIFKGEGPDLRAVETGREGMPATADKWRATLAATYTWAQGKGLVVGNPCEGISNAFDAKGAARTNYLRGDSLLKFWAALEADNDTDTRDALKLMLFTGQRRGNVLCMQWADVDLSAGVWSLGASQTKQKKAQTTPLVAQAAAILQRRVSEAANARWVFPATRKIGKRDLGAMSETRLRDAWARICAAAGIVGLRPHDLRHTSGSWLARLGASEAVRQKALGHQTPAMAARYSHLELDPVADALQRVADAVVTEATKRSFKDRLAKP
jgi:integrase